MPGKQPQFVDATFHVIIKPEWGRGVDDQGRSILQGAKLDRSTITRPQSMPPGGGVVARLTVRLDADCLLPLMPDAVIHVHAGDVETIQVNVEPPEEMQDDDRDA